MIEICISIVAGMIALMVAFYKGVSHGSKREKGKVNDSYAKHLRDISDAAGVQPTGGVQDDPNNRDR